MNIVEFENPEGVIASLGGQTAINLASPLRQRGVKIIGTGCDAIDKAEDRDMFEKLLLSLNIPRPQGKAVTNIEDGVRAPMKSDIRFLSDLRLFSAEEQCRLFPTKNSFVIT